MKVKKGKNLVMILLKKGRARSLFYYDLRVQPWTSSAFGTSLRVRFIKRT